MLSSAEVSCPFKALGISPTMDLSLIKDAFRGSIGRYHSDKNPDATQEDKARTQKLIQAYKTLKCEEKRRGAFANAHSDSMIDLDNIQTEEHLRAILSMGKDDPRTDFHLWFGQHLGARLKLDNIEKAKIVIVEAQKNASELSQNLVEGTSRRSLIEDTARYIRIWSNAKQEVEHLLSDDPYHKHILGQELEHTKRDQALIFSSDYLPQAIMDTIRSLPEPDSYSHGHDIPLNFLSNEILLNRLTEAYDKADAFCRENNYTEENSGIAEIKGFLPFIPATKTAPTDDSLPFRVKLDQEKQNYLRKVQSWILDDAVMQIECLRDQSTSLMPDLKNFTLSNTFNGNPEQAPIKQMNMLDIFSGMDKVIYKYSAHLTDENSMKLKKIAADAKTHLLPDIPLPDIPSFSVTEQHAYS